MQWVFGFEGFCTTLRSVLLAYLEVSQNVPALIVLVEDLRLIPVCHVFGIRPRPSHRVFETRDFYIWRQGFWHLCVTCKAGLSEVRALKEGI